MADTLPTHDLSQYSCPDCGYDLRGAAEGRCSECGFTIDLGTLDHPRLPWARRGELGRLRGYVSTVWWVTCRNRLFREEILRPVCPIAARRFALLTSTWLYAVYAAAIGANYYATGELPFESLGMHETEAWLTCFFSAALALHLWISPRLAPCFFAPRELNPRQRQRAVALSFYTCAPLAILPVALFVTFGVMQYVRHPYMQVIVSWLPIAVLALWLFEIARLASRILPHGKPRHAATLAPLSWLVVSLILLVALPAAALYIVLIVGSLLV
jgi:hypothetical protein